MIASPLSSMQAGHEAPTASPKHDPMGSKPHASPPGQADGAHPLDASGKTGRAHGDKSRTHDSKHDDEHDDFASHLLKALKPTAHASSAMPLPIVAPHTPAPAAATVASTSTHAKRAQQAHKPGSHADDAAPARSTHDRERPSIEAALRSPSSESSTRAVAAFSLEPTKDLPRAADVPVPPAAPAWMPADAVMDDTARMAIFPHGLNWTSDLGSMQLHVRNGEVTLRAQGELAASLRSSESELRVALAQKGLELHESDSSNTGDTDRGSRQQPQQQQQNGQETDEWT